MATQTVVKADKVKNLAEFVARAGKAANFGFDPETREATIYTDATHATKVKSFPWKREVDTLTVLTEPLRFSTMACATASSRLVKLKEQRGAQLKSGEEGLRTAEAAILEAWRSYNAATSAVKPSLRRPILLAEETYMRLVKSMVPPNRFIREFKRPEYRGLEKGFYIPPIPVELRGIQLTGAAGEEAPASASAGAGAGADAEVGDDFD